MSFKLPDLPFHKDDFGKIISSQTFDYHYGRHHKTYVDQLNTFIKGTQWEHKTLNQIVLNCKDVKIFNNGAQHWNHTFFWHCLTPHKTEPTGQLKQAIEAKWGSVDKFLLDFCHKASEMQNFGSGWTWLAKLGNDISIVNTSNAGNPLTAHYHPLLTVDVWQHAYYIDYRNARDSYLKTISNHINWKFVEGNYKSEQVNIKI